MPDVLATLDEIVRIPSPAPAPQALAYDGSALWLGSWETSRIYAIDPNQGSVSEETEAPGKPVGSVPVGDELRFVLSEADDNRFMRRYIPGHGFKTERTACPEDTGSFLAFDGSRLWLSQRYNKRLLALDAASNPVKTIPIGEEIVGFAWVRGTVLLSLWLGRDRGGCRLATIDPGASDPQLSYVCTVPFVAVSLAADGETCWTNDFKKNEIVRFNLPAF
jgi:hypothetical protein